MSFDILNAVVVGCGQIGGGHETFSHGAAYTAHDKFKIIACVDPSDDARAAFKKVWNVDAGFKNLDDLFASGVRADVVSVAVPTEHHFSTLKKLLDHPPKAVFCEKPLTGGINTAQEIVQLYNLANIPLAVNYHRRWDVSLKALKEEIQGGHWGHIQTIVGVYMKGLWQNGSHLLNLVEYLAGPLNVLSVTGSKPGLANDPTVDAVLSTRNGARVHLVGLECDPFYIHELTIFCEKGGVSIENAGLQIRRRHVENDPIFPGERRLDAGEMQNSKQDTAFYNAVDNIHKAITENAALECSGNDALSTLELCSHLTARTTSLCTQ